MKPEDTPWRKSSRSGTNGGSCVEVRVHNGRVETRDTKDRNGGALSFDPAAWQAFIDDVHSGEFDR